MQEKDPKALRLIQSLRAKAIGHTSLNGIMTHKPNSTAAIRAAQSHQLLGLTGASKV
jgi:hypothetical protein